MCVTKFPCMIGFSLFTAVHSDVWRGGAGPDRPVSDSGEALLWLCTPSQTLHVSGLQHQLLPPTWEERYWSSYMMLFLMLEDKLKLFFLEFIAWKHFSFLFFSFSQTLRAGITSAGVTWCPSMESATTSSMASSAASPAQIQTYNHMSWVCLCHPQIGS